MISTLANQTGAILAGGFGTRLRSVVSDRPKVLAPIGSRPYLTYLLDQLAGAGIRRVVLLTGYMADAIETMLGDSYAGMRLIYSPEPLPLGTAGALRLALPMVSSDSVLLLNGDSYCDVKLPDFWDFHCRQAADASMVLSEAADTARFGRVHIGRELVDRFAEKQESSGAGWINAGIYVINRQLIEEIPEGRAVSLEREMFPAWVSRQCLYGFRCRGRFLDIGTPQSYVQAQTFFDAAEQRRRVG